MRQCTASVHIFAATQHSLAWSRDMGLPKAVISITGSKQGSKDERRVHRRKADRINVDTLGSSSLGQLRQDVAQGLYQAQLCHLRCICTPRYALMRHYAVASTPQTSCKTSAETVTTIFDAASEWQLQNHTAQVDSMNGRTKGITFVLMRMCSVHCFLAEQGPDGMQNILQTDWFKAPHQQGQSPSS